jgi:hypothetical protein
MAGKNIINKLQLGDNGNPLFNFLISTLENGSMKIQRGNDGGALTDVLTIDSNGKVTSAFDTAAGQLQLVANGYVKFANGLILQWGGGTTSSGASVNVLYPIAFPGGVLSVQTQLIAGTNSFGSIFDTPSLTGFAMRGYSDAGSLVSRDFRWLAVGY